MELLDNLVCTPQGPQNSSDRFDWTSIPPPSKRSLSQHFRSQPIFNQPMPRSNLGEFIRKSGIHLYTIRMIWIEKKITIPKIFNQLATLIIEKCHKLFHSVLWDTRRIIIRNVSSPRSISTLLENTCARAHTRTYVYYTHFVGAGNVTARPMQICTRYCYLASNVAQIRAPYPNFGIVAPPPVYNANVVCIVDRCPASQPSSRNPPPHCIRHMWIMRIDRRYYRTTSPLNLGLAGRGRVSSHGNSPFYSTR